MEQAIIQEFEKVWEKAFELYGVKIAQKSKTGRVYLRKPHVKISKRKCFRKMGSARIPWFGIDGGEITLYLWVLERYGMEQMIDTIAHEMAHIVAGYFGDRGHGKEWKRISTELGSDGKRIYDGISTNREIHGSMAVEYMKRRPFVYSCGCQEFRLTSVRHKRIQVRGSYLACKTCHNPLVFVREER